MSKTKEKITHISNILFGGILVADGAGHYPGIELINFVLGEGKASLPQSETVGIYKQAHDFARKLVWDEDFKNNALRDIVFSDDIDGKESEVALRNLFESLKLELANIRKRPSWSRAHFFPYTKSLVHWDGRDKGKNVNLERKYLRGGGALAYKILRLDSDVNRRRKIEIGFNNIYKEENKPLEKLSHVLLMLSKRSENIPDDIEHNSFCFDDYPLYDFYRDGILNILEHDEVSCSTRIKSVVQWTGFWLILHQKYRAEIVTQQQPVNIIIDCQSKKTQLRSESRRRLKSIISNIKAAYNIENQGLESKVSERLIDKESGFFASTAATVKLLNAHTGKRHFKLGLELLETMVLAYCPRNSENSYSDFLDKWLYDKCGFVVGRKAAEHSGLASLYDMSVFADNENALAVEMAAAGLLTHYSDHTKMIGTRGLI